MSFRIRLVLSEKFASFTLYYLTINQDLQFKQSKSRVNIVLTANTFNGGDAIF